MTSQGTTNNPSLLRSHAVYLVSIREVLAQLLNRDEGVWSFLVTFMPVIAFTPLVVIADNYPDRGGCRDGRNTVLNNKASLK